MLSVVQIIGRQRERAEEGLRNLLEQRVHEPFEIILVDLRPESQPLAGSTDPRVRVVSRPGLRRFSRAMADGVEAAQGDYVAFIEDHCHSQPGWAAAVLREFRRGVEIVNYAFIDVEPNTYVTRSLLMVEYGRWLHPARPGPIPIASCANIAYRRDVLTKYAAERARERGYQISFDPGAVVTHIHPISFGGLFQDRFARGRDFGFARLESRDWPRLRCLAYMAAAPIIPLAMTLRAGGHAARSQRFVEWVLHTPLQLLFHSVWLAGEWTALLSHVARGRATSV